MHLLLNSAALSLLAAVVVWLAGRRDPACSPRLTSWCLLALLALPLLAILPKYEVAMAATRPGGTPPVPSPLHLALFWLPGLFLGGLRLAGDAVSLRRWRSRAIDPHDPDLRRSLEACRRRAGLEPGVRVRLHPETASPVIAGLRRPVIYLPPASRRWTPATLQMVLLHELGHVVRRDLWIALAARLACLVHWFNPLVWWLRRRLLAQCEFACDARVIAAGADPARYAAALCEVAEGGAAAPPAALAMAGRASLRQRVERLGRRPRTRRSLLVGTALALTVSASFALSVIRFSAPAGNPPSYPPEEIEIRLTADPFPAD